MNLLKGKVAKIIDEYRVVLNIGYDKNVEEGMRFIIYELGDEIKDPDTDESLGNYENVKAKVRIVNVSEKFSTAESDETISYGPVVPVTVAMVTAMGNGREERKKLPLSDDVKKDIYKSDSVDPIKIGDLVRQIIE